MTSPDPELERTRRLVQAAREAMARRDRSLDRETLSRLRHARAKALERQGASVSLWLPVGAALTAVLMIALLWPRHSQPEMPLIAGGEWLLDDGMEIELMENMEFYRWLAEGAPDDFSL